MLASCPWKIYSFQVKKNPNYLRICHLKQISENFHSFFSSVGTLSPDWHIYRYRNTKIIRLYQAPLMLILDKINNEILKKLRLLTKNVVLYLIFNMADHCLLTFCIADVINIINCKYLICINR